MLGDLGFVVQGLSEVVVVDLVVIFFGVVVDCYRWCCQVCVCLFFIILMKVFGNRVWNGFLLVLVSLIICVIIFFGLYCLKGKCMLLWLVKWCCGLYQCFYYVIVEVGLVWVGIDGVNLDVEWFQFGMQGFGEGFQGMFGGVVGVGIGFGDQVGDG